MTAQFSFTAVFYKVRALLPPLEPLERVRNLAPGLNYYVHVSPYWQDLQ